MRHGKVEVERDLLLLGGNQQKLDSRETRREPGPKDMTTQGGNGIEQKPDMM